MLLQTKMKIERTGLDLGYKHRFFCIGSCFAENLMQYFKGHKFNVSGNPSGIIYNPISVANLIQRLCDREFPQKEQLFYHQGLYHHFQFHGSFSSPCKDEAHQAMLESMEGGRKNILEADLLILTLGTAYGFFHREQNELVSNCHKLPGGDFDRRMIYPAQIRERLHEAIQKLLSLNPGLRIVFTVSPIRHIRDGLINNSRSKSALILAIDYLLSDLGESAIYFPAYEVVMDELRDYRFYNSDLIHLREEAVRYIMELFANAVLSADSIRQLNRVREILDNSRHRPLHPSSEPNQKFIKASLEKILMLKREMPDLDFSAEERTFKNQLTE